MCILGVASVGFDIELYIDWKKAVAAASVHSVTCKDEASTVVDVESSTAHFSRTFLADLHVALACAWRLT